MPQHLCDLLQVLELIVVEAVHLLRDLSVQVVDHAKLAMDGSGCRKGFAELVELSEVFVNHKYFTDVLYGLFCLSACRADLMLVDVSPSKRA